MNTTCRLVDELYHNHYIDSWQQNFINLIQNLSNNDKVNILIYACEKYDYQFCDLMFNSFPELWKNLLVENWIELIYNSIQQYDVDADIWLNVNSGCLTTLRFMHGVMGVSPFKCLLEFGDITLENKISMIKTIRNISTLFIIDLRSFIEDVVTFYDVHLFNDIIMVKNNLIEKDFPKAFDNQELLIEYLNNELQKLQ